MSWWIFAAILAMIVFGVNNVILKLFLEKGDWRIFIPPLTVAGIALLIYFFLTLKDINFSRESLLLGCTLAILGGISAFCFLQAVEKGPLSIVMPIVALNIIITAVIQISRGVEPMKPTIVLGIFFALLSIFLLTR